MVKIDENEKQFTYKKLTFTVSMKCELISDERACMIYFYMNSFMEYQKLDLIASIFTVNKTSLKELPEKRDMTA